MAFIKYIFGSLFIAIAVAVIYLGLGFLWGKSGKFVGPYFYESAHNFRVETIATIHSLKRNRNSSKSGTTYDYVVSYHWENYDGELCYSDFYNAAQRNWRYEEFERLTFGDALPVITTTYECHAIVKPSNLMAVRKSIINRMLLLSSIGFACGLIFLIPSANLFSLSAQVRGEVRNKRVDKKRQLENSIKSKASAYRIGKKAKSTFELPDASKAKEQRDLKNTAKPINLEKKAAYIEKKYADVSLPEMHHRVTISHRVTLILLALITFAFVQGWLVEVNTLSPLGQALTNISVLTVIIVCCVLPYKSNQIIADEESIEIPSIWTANRRTKIRYADIETAEVRRTRGSSTNGVAANHLAIKYAGEVLKLHENTTVLEPNDWLFGNPALHELEQYLHARKKIAESKGLLISRH